MKNPLLSICIPVYGTEKTLKACLESFVPLTSVFFDFEILVLSDCSSGCDEEGRGCKQIVTEFKKKLKKVCRKVSISFFENKQNLGTNETRRNLVLSARGKYVFMVDSDDSVVWEGVYSLVQKAQSSDYDILNASFSNAKQSFNLELSNHDIFYNFLVEKKVPGFLWEKFIKRELLLEAFDKIPPTFCTFSEDFLILFFATLFSKSYFSTETIIYNYNYKSGISSRTKIDTLERWERVCSTASVFSIIYLWLDEQEKIECKEILSKTEKDALGQFAVRNLALNLEQMKQMVVPELLPEARKMLGEYWGEELVCDVEKKQGQKMTL